MSRPAAAGARRSLQAVVGHIAPAPSETPGPLSQARALRYVSVCSGIEAATVAWHPLGWVPVCFSEIEPFPRRLLAHHYPHVRLVGDFTTLLEDPPAADLLVGGTPCQAFSVAGKRLSLEDYRGNLTLAFADLAFRGGYEWVLWENVPGVLSTPDNAFGCLLGRLCGEDTALEPPGGRWANAGVVSGSTGVAAWRILDAQWFGVAQRRRRVFVLFGRGAGNWAPAEALLPFEPRLQRHPPPRRGPRQGAQSVPPGGARVRGADLPEVAGCLGMGQDRGFRTTDLDSQGAFIPEVGGLPETSKALGASPHLAHREDRDTLVPEVTGSLTRRYGHAAMGAPEVDANLFLPEVVGTLADGAHYGGGANGQDAYSGRIIPVPAPAAPPPVTLSSGQANAEELENLAPTLTTLHEQPLVATTPVEVPELADPITANEQRTYTHEGTTFRTRNVIVEAEAPAVFDTTQVTNPDNRSNPEPGDPAHPLSASAHPPLVVIPGGPPGDLYGCEECGHKVSLLEHPETCPQCGGSRLENLMIRPTMGPHRGMVYNFDTGAYEPPVEPVASSCKDDGGDSGEVAPTLRALEADQGRANGGGQIAVAFKASHFTRGKDGAPDELAPPLSADADKGDQDTLLLAPAEPRAFTVSAQSDTSQRQTGVLVPEADLPVMVVRRLTPRECERLQGFPDDYTLIPGAKDSHRYRALGNSMAVPVMGWIGRQIELVRAAKETA